MVMLFLMLRKMEQCGTYDLRTAEGVSGLRDYMEKEAVREKE